MRRTNLAGARALVASMAMAALVWPLAGCDEDPAGTRDADVIAPDIVPSECQYDQQCQGQVTTGTCEVARCVSGRCEAVAAPVWSPCELAGAGECERGGCNPQGACVLVTADNGTPCDTGAWNECVGFQCQGGLCQELAVKTCNDDNPCTDDTCVPGTGCVFSANAASCDDLNPCTGGDTCAEGVCVGTEILCQCDVDADCAAFDDGDLCNGVLMCDAAAGLCVPKPNSAVTCDQDDVPQCQQRACVPATGQCQLTAGPDFEACDDGDACTGCAPGESCAQKDFCQGGVCKAGLGEPCQCDEDTDCVVFDDGDLCNGAWTCQDGTCALAEDSEVDCSLQQAPPCQALVCDPETGTCGAEPLEDGAACDDGDACTGGDSCQAGECVAGAEDLCACEADEDCAGFDDGAVCNGTWTCQDGACAFDPATVVDCSGEVVGACQIAVCSEEVGGCDVIAADDGTACDDGDACTGGDACQAGACVAGEVDACACEDDLACAGFDDGDLCNGTWVCEIAQGETVGTCVADPTPVTCTTEAQCVTVACVPATGLCEETILEGGEPCDDDDLCTSGETCAAGGVCTPAETVTCESVGQCKSNTCDPASGECVEANLDNGTPCDGALACFTGDQCMGGVCVDGLELDCDACPSNPLCL